jgi:pimeloyl-ACP methyl ester carboxylesterase
MMFTPRDALVVFHCLAPQFVERGIVMERRSFLKAAGAGIAVSAAAAPAIAQSPGVTFLVCTGAWSAGWAWKKMHPLMSAAGHRLVTPTYTGLGEREHLAAPSNDLETHVQDMLAVIKYEDLRDIVLIGHSYGGLVATGVADRARDRISQLIYLDAFVPKDGQSLMDANPPMVRQRMQETAKAGDGWRVPSNPIPPDTSEADVKWISERRVAQSIKCFDTPLRMRGGELTLPRSYIYLTRVTPADPFRPFAERAKNDSTWRYYELDASHSPHVTTPGTLMALLQRIISEPV